MSEQTFTITVNVKELFTAFIPSLAKQYLSVQKPEEVKGAGMTLSIDVSGSIYSYSIGNGGNFEVTEGPLENPTVYLGIPLESMAKLADMKNIGMPLGMQGQLGREKNNVLTGLNGTSVFRLKHEDGEISEITATFNGAQSPKAVISMSMEDAAAVTSRKQTPVQLFMNGRMVIDGDIAFAIAMQPLFL